MLREKVEDWWWCWKSDCGRKGRKGERETVTEGRSVTTVAFFDSKDLLIVVEHPIASTEAEVRDLLRVSGPDAEDKIEEILLKYHPDSPMRPEEPSG